ncbi:MAG: YggS family pyridoxal phosphate-dependent enzyme [Bacteroidetes bacterium]|jgi:pyridoxal phosphate enzyme (YggS family)|nr:YggS family pyridoxal phosphate-dependent enzyme [Bacteroidota bacterium]
MSINIENYKKIKSELEAKKVQLIAVSKLKPASDIEALYNIGQRDFGENYVQELVEKYEALKHLSINWHFIGHLQSNKVKFIAPFIQLIQSVDSLKLLQEINKQATKHNRIIDCLLQVYIAKEETKYGLDESEIQNIFNEVEKGNLKNISIKGFMAMASFVDDESIVREEFQQLVAINSNHKIQDSKLSFGMSQDYKLAIEEGSNIVRIGSLLFGARK